ncbi:MAG: DUF3568 family protein [Leptolyngbya sp. PLA2]|nr:DUF3568 family protein [Leptolyngbya sp.]MCE7971317.1 DUF3568 family protein [Leptolyngbya sp. PL-A2]MCQ3940534.1 DUF3568 domain-containing protein [cyanobacterium CYA1]MCZ7632470.1 DUF3568 domain-containing protein [Phycisphaerales bacterium]MDL1903504.1 DUF3568 family protein [Synechococcales cyanobacterium CNB]
MKRLRGFCAGALVAIGGTVVCPGCTVALVAGAAAAGIAGTYVYTEGRLESVEDAPLAEVHAAALKAVDDLGFTLVRESQDAFNSIVTAKRADNSDVNIALEKKSDKTTSVRIRVGIVGDEAVSTEILTRIRANLKA